MRYNSPTPEPEAPASTIERENTPQTSDVLTRVILIATLNSKLPYQDVAAQLRDLAHFLDPSFETLRRQVEEANRGFTAQETLRKGFI